MAIQIPFVPEFVPQKIFDYLFYAVLMTPYTDFQGVIRTGFCINCFEVILFNHNTLLKVHTLQTLFSDIYNLPALIQQTLLKQKVAQ